VIQRGLGEIHGLGGSGVTRFIGRRAAGLQVREGTEATDLKNGATEKTEESEKKDQFSFPFSSLAPLLRF
jgi:hypothetical protein